MRKLILIGVFLAGCNADLTSDRISVKYCLMEKPEYCCAELARTQSGFVLDKCPDGKSIYGATNFFRVEEQ
jgi:hypothetical protein